ncbi:MAG TPA: hypothetical protein VI111_05595, partial [Thermoleophilaceae bacterium]
MFRKRKLLLPAVLAGFIAVAAVCLAAPGLDAIAGSGELTGAAPLERPAIEHEAHSKLRQATARAKRKATPPAP